jgi:phosphatidate cytidylyltransferase
MRQRIIVGLIALPAVLIPLWLGGVWAVALFLIIGINTGLEFYHLLQIGGYHPNRVLGLAWLTAMLFSYWQPHLLPLALVTMAGMIISLIAAMHETNAPMHTWMATAIGALYFGTMIGQGLALRQLPNGQWWLIFGLFVTWANDSAAYFVGVTWGRHKLWPRLSPKKTWEGTVAGWVAAGVVGAAWVAITPLAGSHTLLFGALLGGACGVLALFGDLAISTLKRQVGVKDSGHFLPGHGGFLDRMDSLLFVVPFVYQVILFGL